jgi:hypothetical protein
MKNRLTAALAIIFVIAGAGAALTANAENRSGIRDAAMVNMAECQVEHWPSYSSQCLLTIDGAPAQRNFRVVAAY